MSQKATYRQKRKQKQRREKKKERRKKDTTQGMPFIIAYQGDPARNYRCGQAPSFRLYYELINASPERLLRNPHLHGFDLLSRYKKHPVQDAGLKGFIQGILYIKDAS